MNSTLCQFSGIEKKVNVSTGVRKLTLYTFCEVSKNVLWGLGSVLKVFIGLLCYSKEGWTTSKGFQVGSLSSETPPAAKSVGKEGKFQQQHLRIHFPFCLL